MILERKMQLDMPDLRQQLGEFKDNFNAELINPRAFILEFAGLIHMVDVKIRKLVLMEDVQQYIDRLIEQDSFPGTFTELEIFIPYAITLFYTDIEIEELNYIVYDVLSAIDIMGCIDKVTTQHRQIERMFRDAFMVKMLSRKSGEGDAEQ